MKKKGRIWIPGLTKGHVSFEVDSEGRRFDVATVCAIVAILMSALSLLLSIVQTVKTQKPYLDIGVYGQNSHEIGVRISNDGPGPAVIKQIEISFRGRKFETFEGLYYQLLDMKFVAPVPIRFSDFGAGTPLLPTGAHKDVITMQPGAADEDDTWHLVRRAMEIRVTYCSLYDQCWKACLRVSDEDCPSPQYLTIGSGRW